MAGLTESIELRVVGQDGTSIHFYMNQTTSMKNLKLSYSERIGKSMSSLRFTYNGRRIRNEETPRSLYLHHDDVIKALVVEEVDHDTLNENLARLRMTYAVQQEQEVLEMERRKAREEEELARRLEDMKRELGERHLREETLMLKKHRAMAATEARIQREVARLETLSWGEEERREVLECPVCYEEMLPPKTIFQCISGHPVCSGCRPRVSRCPNCRGKMMVGRNIGLEQVMREFV